MSFIGREGRPAPKLKDAQLSSAELELAYEDVIRTMKTLYDDWLNNQNFLAEIHGKYVTNIINTKKAIHYKFQNF